MNTEDAKNSLSREAVEEISSVAIHAYDKWRRMYAGISSNLEAYENGIMYLTIRNSEKRRLSNYYTAIDYVVDWRRWCAELRNAKGYVITFYKCKVTGFMVPGTDVVDEIKGDAVTREILRTIKEMQDQEYELVNIFSGLITDELFEQIKSFSEVDPSAVQKSESESDHQQEDDENQNPLRSPLDPSFEYGEDIAQALSIATWRKEQAKKKLAKEELGHPLSTPSESEANPQQDDAYGADIATRLAIKTNDTGIQD